MRPTLNKSTPSRSKSKAASPTRASKKKTVTKKKGKNKKKSKSASSIKDKERGDGAKKKPIETKSKAKKSKTAKTKNHSANDEQSVQYGEVDLLRGAGGETHQRAQENQSVLTTQQGVAIADGQNTLTVGASGPQLLEDFVMREKIFHFDHERIPERVVHARGYGARGYFESYDDLSDITQASPFKKKGARTDVFVRFSTVAGSAGSADLARDARGFAVKFYTETGNWDLVGNNIPVFFIQDAVKFPDLIHSVKPEPHTGFPQAQSAHDNFWDFISLMPEATHMLLWTMSDRGIPRGFRFMEGFGVHTFRFVNSEGQSTYVKFHWKPVLGVQSVLWNEAVKINGADPDYHRRDLWNAIDAGDYPEWELGVQLFDDEFADNFAFDVLDPTKLIPEEDIPVKIIGKMVLNRNVDNVFAETEQVAFCTANVVPGIDFTNDPLLQGRNFSYLDTQLKRLGSPNFTQIPVNAPRCPFAHFQRDGHMTTVTPKGRANYEPNSWTDEAGPRESATKGFTTHNAFESGEKRRLRPESFADHYSQARQFYMSQTDVEQTHIADAIVFELSKVKTLAIRERVVSHLINVNQALADAVAASLGMAELPTAANAAAKPRHDLAESAALSILANSPSTFKGRTLGLLVCDGSDAKTIRALRKALKAEGANLTIISTTISGIADSDGNELAVDEKIEGGPSVLFDAVAVILTEAGAQELIDMPAARDFVSDAHAHCKRIGANQDALALFDAAGIKLERREIGYYSVEPTRVSATQFIEACRLHRAWERG